MGSQISGFGAPRNMLPDLARVNDRLMRGRAVEDVPDAIRDLSEQTQVYIMSVGPWPQMQRMGSLGSYHIPACKAGEPFSEPVIIPGIPYEHYPIREGVLDVLIGKDNTGMNLALQILQVGKFQLPGNSLMKYGCFVSATYPPSRAEVDAANLALDNECNNLIDEANMAYSKGPAAWQEVRYDRHFWAAARLGKSPAECPWMNRSAAIAKPIECMFCGTPMAGHLSVCPNCNKVTNEKRYKAAQQAAKEAEE